MCQPRNEGGRRCASHTRPGFQAVLDAVNHAPTRQASQDAWVAGMDAVAAHAATPTGDREITRLLTQAKQAGDDTMVEVLEMGQRMSVSVNQAFAEREGDIAARVNASRTSTCKPAFETASEPSSATGSTDASAGQSADERFLATADKQGRVRLADHSVVVHPRNEWPIHYLRAHPARTATLGPDTPVHTTQRAVYADHVYDKGDATDRAVTVALEPVPGGQRIWVVDGHHTLVAARRHGLPVQVEIHQAGTGDPISPPRLFTRTQPEPSA